MSIVYSSPIQEGFSLQAKFYQLPTFEPSVRKNEGACRMKYQGSFYQVSSTFKTSGDFKAKIDMDVSVC